MEDEIKAIIMLEYGSINNFCKQFDFPWSTVKAMLTRGINNSSVSNVIKLCDALNLDVEELTKGKLINKHLKESNNDYVVISCTYERGRLSETDKEEIEQFVEFIKYRKKGEL